MIVSNPDLTYASFKSALSSFWDLSGAKILSIDNTYDYEKSTPVFTQNGKYTSRGWTEWTQGFVFGSAILQFDATGDQSFLNIGKDRTIKYMASHVSHIGVHDHGFNNVSTYGNLLRLIHENKMVASDWEKSYYELAIKLSGAAQASRWTDLDAGKGYIYSFNGPHSLFVDTIRTLRVLMLSHKLGHHLQTENDKRINLADRAIEHLRSTASYAVYYGEGRDIYDIEGRTAHESIFNTNDGNYRCPGTQQGYSGFTTWTRGLAWAMCGYAEQLEFLAAFPEIGSDSDIREVCEKAAYATCHFYMAQTPTCGIPYWDTGAPNLHKLGDYLDRDAEPNNAFEPVDSSAAAIAAQGLLRFSQYLKKQNRPFEMYENAGLKIVHSLLNNDYLSKNESHQGLLLHSVYHRPNGWDAVPLGQKVPAGESSMWGDYHMRELMLYVQRMAQNEKYYTFFN